MAQVNDAVLILLRVARLAHGFFRFFLDHLVAGGSLLAVAFLLLYLYEVISYKGASYPPIPPVSGNSLAKPIFLRSGSVETPKTFSGTALSVSPNGAMFAYLGGYEEASGQDLFVADLDNGQAKYIWPYVSRPVWSPDSTQLLFQARQENTGAVGVAIASVDGNSFDWIVPPHDGSALNPLLIPAPVGWSLDGKTVLFLLSKVSDGSHELWRLELESGQRQRLALLPRESDKPNSYVRSLSLSPDRKKVSFINADRVVAERSATWWIMNVDGSSTLALMKRGQSAGFVRDWTWTADSKQLIYDVRTASDSGFQPTTLWLSNSDGTARRQIPNSDNIDGFALSPKGAWAIYGKENHLWMANLETGKEEQLTFGDDYEGRPLWLANGDLLYHHRVGSITSLRILDYAEAAEIPGLTTTPTPAKAP